MISTIAVLMMGVAAVLDVVASFVLMRSDLHTTVQKVVQLVLIWILPFVGATVVISVAWNDRRHHPPHVGSDALGYSMQPGSDGDVNIGDANSDHWGGGHGDGHV